MKPFSYYSTNPLSYPSKDDFTTVYAYLRGQVLWQGSARDWPDAKGTLLPNHTVEKVVDEDAFKAARIAYGAESGRLNEEFMRDLFEEHGVTGHPKAAKCYSIAYDYGHSAGHQEVASHFETLVELIKDWD